MVLRAAVTVLILVLPKTPLRVILPKREKSLALKSRRRGGVLEAHNLVGPFLRLGKLDANVTWNTVG